MVKNRIELIQKGLPGIIERWLQQRNLLKPNEKIQVQITVLPTDFPRVKVSVVNRESLRAHPKKRTDPCLTAEDWEKILTHPWRNKDDRLALAMLKEKGSGYLTDEELSQRLDRQSMFINDGHITNQLKRLGLGDLRLLRHTGLGCALFRMV